MKLLDKYSRVHIITSLVVLLISSLAYYFIIQFILIKQIDNDLKVEEQEIQDYIFENKTLPQASDYRHQLIRFEEWSDNAPPKYIANTMEYDSSSQEYEPYRRLSFQAKVNDQIFLASVYKSRLETEDLLQVIMAVTAVIFIFLIVAIFIINRFVLRKLWQPFIKTLSELRNFNLHNKQYLNLTNTNIQEFKDLNRSVSQMTEKMSSEYETLKAFTDNASHEMQTPLAIIRSKLDLLLQSSSEDQADNLQVIYDATGRLSKLNQALLLLTKIDNKQFQNSEYINLEIFLKEKFQQFEELINSKNISQTYDLQEAGIFINRELINILFNNLLSNAIKHNTEGGIIDCQLHADGLSISNSGSPLAFDKEKIFNRFQKSNNSDGIGLGLAVVKQICDAHDLSIYYNYSENKHTFNIVF